MASIIQIDYDRMRQVAEAFEQQAAEVKRVLQNIEQQISVLKADKWKAESATAYYNSMDNEVCPAVNKLSQKLDLASDMCKQISQNLKKAEEDAASALPTNI
jgi:WXG100 family type VII secretion target